MDVDDIVKHELQYIGFFSLVSSFLQFYEYSLQNGSIYPSECLRFVLLLAFVMAIFYSIYKDFQFYAENYATLLTHMVRLATNTACCMFAYTSISLICQSNPYLVDVRGSIDSCFSRLDGIPLLVAFKLSTVIAAAWLRIWMSGIGFLYLNSALIFKELGL